MPYKSREDRIRSSRKPQRLAKKREVNRRASLARYGLTVEKFESILRDQDGLCAMPDCRSPEPGGKGQWHVDHDHSTGRVRGILCHKCNITLGYYEKNTFRHEVFKKYLAF